MKNLVSDSADEKMTNEIHLSKLGEKALTYVQKMERIQEIEKELKVLKLDTTKLEAELIPQIGMQYKPKNLDFILQPKISKGRKTTLYANVVKLALKTCKFTPKQIEIFNQLVKDNTKMPVDKKTIQIIKPE
jgi:predicted DNA-binding transcriptional regulator